MEIITRESADLLSEAIVLQAVQDLKDSYAYLQMHSKEESTIKRRLEETQEKIHILQNEGYDYSKSQKAYNSWYRKMTRLESAKRNVDECEKFFKGDFFPKICTLDGQRLIDRCKYMAINRVKINKGKNGSYCEVM